MNLRIQCVLLLALLILTSKSFCQAVNYDTAMERQLVANIYRTQVFHEEEFLRGVIPSYREHNQRGPKKNDTNIFFTALAAFTLRNLYPYLEASSQELCDTIFKESATAFTYYQNRKGRPTYNFWRTDRPEIFPNAGLLNIFNKSHAPADDLDNTAIILVALDSPDSTVKNVHRLMQAFANNNNKRVAGSLPGYKNIHTYSAWFGKKTPIELDFGVLANILYMIHKYNLPFANQDSAAVEFMELAIRNRHHITSAPRLSPYYNRTSVLLYHVARLMSIAKIPELEKWKPQLIEDAMVSYKNSSDLIDKIMLSTTLLRWGVVLPDDTLTIQMTLNKAIESSNAVFFMGNMASLLPAPLDKLLYHTGIGTFYFYCPGWNYALILENMVTRKMMLLK